MTTWFAKYLKNYRDALAHRIPPYIPPATYSDEEVARSSAIDSEQWECIRNRDWKRAEELATEQQQLGAPCPMFMHSFDATENAKLIYLHPQMLSDAKTVIEACNLFFAHWHEWSN